MPDEKRIIRYVLRKLRRIPSPGPGTTALLCEIELADRILENIPSYRWDEIIPAIFPLEEDKKPDDEEENADA